MDEKQNDGSSNDKEVVKYCLECGSEVDPDSDFCYLCGSRKVFSVNPNNNRVIMDRGHCPFCGHDNIPDARFCSSCGKRIGEFEYVPTARRKLEPIHYLAIFLALLPGAFNIFGLGHIVMRKYSRGFMYLCFSTVLLYIMYSAVNASYSMLIMIEVIGLVIYLKQASEVFRLVFGN